MDVKWDKKGTTSCSEEGTPGKVWKDEQDPSGQRKGRKSSQARRQQMWPMRGRERGARAR